MRQLMPDLFLIEGLQGANVYLLTSRDELTLVDSGTREDVEKISAQIKEAGFSLEDLAILLLTHGHGDHMGGAGEIVRRSGARVIAHQAEVDYIEGRAGLPSPSFIQRLMFWLSDHLVMPREPCPVDHPVKDGEQIQILGGMQIIHTPGHTQGSISLYHPQKKILLCGDALFNQNPLNGNPGLRLPLRMVTLDNQLAYQSAVKITQLDVELLCPGHGEPIQEETNRKIASLLS